MSTKSISGIRLIVGLGNPGAQYEDTRHNAGFWFVDLVANRYGGCFKSEVKFYGQLGRIQVAGNDCWLLKPSTFMNHSGQSVSSLARYYKISIGEILVAHDELDLSAGELRLKLGGGHAGHNGLRDIITAMGGGAFPRLRIGIDHPGDRGRVVDYVLSRPSREDACTVHERLEQVSDVLPLIIAGNFQKVMNSLHSPN